MNSYVAHGLCVDSELHLPAARERAGGDADLVLRQGASSPPSGELIDGALVAQLQDPDGFGYCISSGPEGHHIHLQRRLDVRFNVDATSVVLSPADGVDPGLVTVLAGGFVLAAALALRGHAVLHSSAVEVDGGAIALLGSSGQGKSTLATMLAEAGGLLISEDVLRVDESPTGWLCRLGSTEVRLRQKAWSIAERMGAASSRVTADGRLAVRPALSQTDLLALRCLLLPHPVHGSSDIVLTRLTGTSAIAELIRHPRIPGWFGGPVPGQQFRASASLASSVPVFRLSVPWGPPFPPETGPRILEAVSDALRR